MTNLQECIKQRLWRCNELSEKQAQDYAWIAMDEMKKWMNECRSDIRTCVTNPATPGFGEVA